MIKFKRKFRLLLFSVAYWLLAAFYFIILHFSAPDINVPADLHYGRVIIYGLAVGVLIGLLFGLFPVSHVLQFRKRSSFLNVLLISTACHILFFMAVIFLASLYGNTVRFALQYLFSPDGLVVLFHFSTASLLYHFLLQISKKFGPGVLIQYASGRYFTPKAEKRVFMFLDLKSSTRLAEALDHVAYSRLVQDCYAQLTTPLLDNKGCVYQYVGDEVVITWEMNRSFTAISCCMFFYSFQKRIGQLSHYFLQTYNTIPEFKAGIHCGQVTVAEVGEIKTEIAYHGDVLNTASRIQSLCNSLHQTILFSETFLMELPEHYRHSVSFVADTALRGKESPTKLFTIADIQADIR